MNIVILYNRFGVETNRYKYSSYSGWPKSDYSIDGNIATLTIATLTYFTHHKKHLKSKFNMCGLNFHKIYCGHYTNTAIQDAIPEEGKFFIFRELIIKFKK